MDGIDGMGSGTPSTTRGTRIGPFWFYGLLFGGLLAGALWATIALWRLQVLVAYCLAINVVTLGAYGVDKRIASTRWSRRSSRVPEALLHVLSLLGGSIGALLGQHLFRHKTGKKRFQIVYWCIVVVQGLALYLVLR